MNILRIALLSAAATAYALTPEQRWFLNETEIAAARGGVDRDMPAIIEGSVVHPLIDGASWMSSLLDDIRSTRKGDFIHFSAFDEDVRIMLRPNPSNPPEGEATRIDNVLIAALARGVMVRGLVNVNLYIPADGFSFCAAINPHCPEPTCCAPDTRHGALSGSLHNKMWVIQRLGETVAYSGSDDVVAGRFDTPAHDGGANRSAEPKYMVRIALCACVLLAVTA